MWVIGTDGGYLDKPVRSIPNGEACVMMPGERYEVIIDFAGFSGHEPASSRNTGQDPLPERRAAAWARPSASIMQFRVGGGLPSTGHQLQPGQPGTPLRTGAQRSCAWSIPPRARWPPA